MVVGGHTDDDGTTLDVTKIVRHPDYEGQSMVNDIAMLKLVNPLTFNENVKPVCKPTPGETYEGKNALIIGWGTLGDGEYENNDSG